MIRSGTTFAGKVLSLPREVDYLHEPFNGGYSRTSGTALEARYVRPSKFGDHDDYYTRVKDIFSYNIKMKTFHHSDDSLSKVVAKHIVGSRGPAYLKLARINPFHRHCVVKDPICKFTTEYLYHVFHVKPVILVRHPLSLAASLKRVGWWPDMDYFKCDRDLVDDYFADEPDFIDRTWSSPLLEAMAHWRATYKVLLAQTKRHPDWQFVTHEDLSARPVDAFHALYERLGLPWSPRVVSRLRDLTTPTNTTEARQNQAMDLSRDSRSIFRHRRDSLSAAERRAIFDVVHDVALEIYPEESFAL